MTQDKENENNPVARLREIYYERRRTPKLTDADKEALRKYKEEQDKKEQHQDEPKVARDSNFDSEVSI